jgi:trans-aconitate methyltransferase
VALSDFDTPADWAADLDRRWPARYSLRASIVDLLVSRLATAELPSMLELGFGDGALLRAVQKRLKRVQLTGVDQDSSLVAHAQDRIPDCTFVEGDLNDPKLWAQMGSYNCIYSFQTFHDLGGKAELMTIYERIFHTLAPGGTLLNADFVVPLGHDDPGRPRRFAPSTHMAILKDIGFHLTSTPLETDLFACIQAVKSP